MSAQPKFNLPEFLGECNRTRNEMIENQENEVNSSKESDNGVISRVVAFAKKAALAALGLIGANYALVGQKAAAAVSFDNTTGFSGSFDLVFYYSAIGIIVTAIAVVAAIKLGILQFKRI
ncbi:hypothetical protein KKA17_08155 [bacterium]|nr:hypothetical protein [bacterium]